MKVSSLLGALLPPRCGVCAAGCDSAALLCRRCLIELERTPTFGAHRLPGLDFAWAAFEHSGLPRRLVAAAKYRARPGLLEIAVQETFERCPPEILGGVTLIPVPPDPWRSRRRGFDLASELAARLTALTDSGVIVALGRSPSRPQAGKDRESRIAAKPRIRVVAPLPPAILLVDDVTTTGTTLAACAAAAREAGVIRIGAITLTRTPQKRL